MPTHAIAAREGDWSRWVPKWLDLQEGVAHCRWWDATWMDLISRVAKHDKHGAKACNQGLATFMHRAMADRCRKDASLVQGLSATSSTVTPMSS